MGVIIVIVIVCIVIRLGTYSTHVRSVVVVVVAVINDIMVTSDVAGIVKPRRVVIVDSITPPLR